jgi:hypothetical protein
MNLTVTSIPFKITLPSGTSLFGITKTRFSKNNNTVSNGTTEYFTEINRTEFDEINSRAGSRFTETFAAPGAGSPKFYKLVGAYNSNSDKKFFPSSLAGAELEQEFAKFNANSSQSPQLNTVVATAVNTVARNQNVPPATVSASLFGSNVSTAQTTQQAAAQPAAAAQPPTPLLPDNFINIPIPNSDASKAVDESLKVQLRYPLTMDGKQDRIKFSVRELKGRTDINVASANTAFNLGKRDLSDILGFVFLPIQPAINDSNGVDWGGTTLNPIQAYAASASLQAATSPGGITGGAAEALRQAAVAFSTGLQSSGYGKAISLYFAQEAVGAQNLLSRTSGAVLNPNLELLFNGPTLRSFSFTFRLSPRSRLEANAVKQIINFFKKGMAVKKANSEVFLKAPNVFEIEYQAGEGNIHRSLNRIKTCALLGCDVDYAPDGTYMTFNDEKRTMTSYQMTLRFSELDPIYNTDYAIGGEFKIEEGEIGF